MKRNEYRAHILTGDTGGTYRGGGGSVESRQIM